MKVLVAQSCPTVCDPMDCSPPGSSVHGILQARILEWVAIPFSRGSSQLRDQAWIFGIAGRLLTTEPPENSLIYNFKRRFLMSVDHWSFHDLYLLFPQESLIPFMVLFSQIFSASVSGTTGYPHAKKKKKLI